MTKDSKSTYCLLSFPPFFEFLGHGLHVLKILFRQIETLLIYGALSFEKIGKKLQNGMTKDSKSTYCLLSFHFSYIFGKKSLTKRQYLLKNIKSLFFLILVNASRYNKRPSITKTFQINLKRSNATVEYFYKME